MFGLFEPEERKQRDRYDLEMLFEEHGDAVPDLLDQRARNSHSPRDRKHWKRLARKARLLQQSEK